MPSTGPMPAGTGENLDRSGLTAWTNPGNITVDDNSVARANAVSGSDYLIARNFGFAIPASAVIDGVVVVVRARENIASGETMQGRLQDDTAALTGSLKTLSYNDGNVETTYTWGGATDLWGATLTPAIVNNANFGFRQWFLTAHDVLVDFVSMEIFYTPGDVILDPLDVGDGDGVIASMLVVKALSIITGDGDELLASLTIPPEILVPNPIGDGSDIIASLVVVRSLRATFGDGDAMIDIPTDLVPTTGFYYSKDGIWNRVELS